MNEILWHLVKCTNHCLINCQKPDLNKLHLLLKHYLEQYGLDHNFMSHVLFEDKMFCMEVVDVSFYDRIFLRCVQSSILWNKIFFKLFTFFCLFLTFQIVWNYGIREFKNSEDNSNF